MKRTERLPAVSQRQRDRFSPIGTDPPLYLSPLLSELKAKGGRSRELGHDPRRSLRIAADRVQLHETFCGFEDFNRQRDPPRSGVGPTSVPRCRGLVCIVRAICAPFLWKFAEHPYQESLLLERARVLFWGHSPRLP